MRCTKCQTENSATRKFCRECGAKLQLVCPECGSENLPDDKFCGECGHNLKKTKEASPIDYSEPQSYTPKFLADKILTTRTSIEGERKLVTVLFADVSDFTSISEKLDPEEVHQIMDGCFKILMNEIHQYEGTINQFTGDGVMALFGAPVAYEDHARRACQSALNIQKAMHQFGQTINRTYDMEFKLRIGLNSGTVVVGAIGDDLRMDYTAVGDTTNLAARMESMAAAGTILVSENTFKLARDFFEFESLGKVAVKGKAKPQDMYRLIKPGPIETRIEASLAKGWTKFVGRQKEINTLTGAFDKVRGGSGQVVGTVGEAGVGKSRLLIEMSKAISKEEYTYLEGRCLPYGGAMPYLPMRDIVRAFFSIQDGDQEFIIKSKLQEKISQLDIQPETILPPLQELLSLGVDDEKYLQLDPGVKKMRTFEAIRDLLLRQGQNKPVIVAVDDLHWIDNSSQEFLSYLIEWLANTHILLILLYRPEYTHQWGNKSYYSQISLDQFTRQTSAALVQAILEGGAVVPKLNELIYNRAGGNPLFVEELTHNLLENGTIEKKDRQFYLARDTSDILVPDNIQGIIAARLDRVEENLKKVLQMASVIGREFAFRILQTILGMSENLKSQMLDLQGLEFISEKNLFPELEYIFKHALTQEVAYNSLLQNRRREIHAKIGNAIEAIYPDRLEEYYELLAHHYERSNNQDKALEYLGFANQKAANISAMEEAKNFFDKAMQLLDSQPDSSVNQERRISLIVNQMIVFELLLNIPEYYDLLIRYEPMAQKSGNQGQLGALYSRIAECEWWFGDYHKAIENANKAIDLAEASGRIEDAAFAYSPLQFCYFFIGEFEKVVALKDQVLRLTDQQFNLRWYVWALCAASLSRACLGRWNQALSLGSQAYQTAKEYGDNSLISFASWSIACAYTWQGDLKQAIEYAERSVEKAPTPGDQVWGQAILAWALNRAGETEKGIAIISEVLPMFQLVRYVSGEIYALIILGEGYWLAGDNERAQQTLDETITLAERCGSKLFTAWAHRLLGQIAAISQPEQAASHFEHSIAALQKINAANELALTQAALGRLYRQLGDIKQARENLVRALEIFEKLGSLVEPDTVRKELEELSDC